MAITRPGEEPLANVLGRNIEALMAMRAQRQRRRTLSERMADAITRFAGSMASAVVHLVVFVGWIVANSGVLPGFAPVDPFPFVGLAMWASCEAIFLTTFVLISQNRQGRMADERADLDLQINLLAEHEVTHLLQLTEAIARHLGLDEAKDPHLEELKRDVAPEKVIEELEHKRPPEEAG